MVGYAGRNSAPLAEEDRSRAVIHAEEDLTRAPIVVLVVQKFVDRWGNIHYARMVVLLPIKVR